MTTKRSKLLPRAGILERAHNIAILRVKNTVSFYLLLVIVTAVVGYFFGFVFGLLLPFLGIFATLLYQIFLGNIFEYAEYVSGIRLYNDESLDMATVFCGFHEYGRIMKAMFWYKLRRSLWLCVPIYGSIKAYSFLMTPYILHCEPNLSAEQAIQRSIQLTDGYKMELFVQDLKLTGWRLLNLLSANIVGIVYFFSYNAVIWTGFYMEIKNDTSGKRNYHFHKDTDFCGDQTSADNMIIPALSKPKRL